MPVYRHQRFKDWINSPVLTKKHQSFGRIHMLAELRAADNPWVFVQDVVAGRTNIGGYMQMAAKRYMREFLDYEEGGPKRSARKTIKPRPLAKKPSKNNAFDPESFYANLLGLPH